MTRDNESAENTWMRIKKNREINAEYDETGDVVRYAGDIIDYLEFANILKCYDGKTYYLNRAETESILKFINSDEWFSGYDKFIEKRTATLQEIKDCEKAWFEYVNKDLKDTDFATDLLAFISDAEQQADDTSTSEFKTNAINEQIQKAIATSSTMKIGDIGELLIINHEKMRLKKLDRANLIHLVSKIPTQLAVGYDVQSVEENGEKRYIEVKTTISTKPLIFNKIHLTGNEWNTATTMKGAYFIYRLSISKVEKKLYLLQNPVCLYKNDEIDMAILNGGAEITFNPQKVGTFEELLEWKD